MARTDGAIIGNSTIYNNSADQGGAVYSFGKGTSRRISLINVTVDSNTADSSNGGGGGIYNTGSVKGPVIEYDRLQQHCQRLRATTVTA